MSPPALLSKALSSDELIIFHEVSSSRMEENPGKEIGLPSKYSWYSAQIAGHNVNQVKKGIRQLSLVKARDNPGQVLKPIQEGERGQCELNFYELMFKTNEPSPGHCALRPLLPHYSGTEIIDFEGKIYRSAEFLVLEDVSAQFHSPAIIDIKMGRYTFEPTASEEKKKRETEKYPPQETLGFRILGYQVRKNSGETRKRSRDWGMSIDENTVYDSLIEYVSVGSNHEAARIRKNCKEIVEKLTAIREVLEKPAFHFFASSLLVVYEGDHNREPRVDIRLIDFSHVLESDGSQDESYLYGLDNLISIFDLGAQEHS